MHQGRVFISVFNTAALLRDCVKIFMHTYPYLVFMVKDQEVNFKYFWKSNNSVS